MRPASTDCSGIGTDWLCQFGACQFSVSWGKGDMREDVGGGQGPIVVWNRGNATLMGLKKLDERGFVRVLAGPEEWDKVEKNAKG
jgi:hypothetical protein